MASNKKTKSKPDKKASDVSSGTDEEEDNRKDNPRKQSISSKHLNLLCIGRTHLFNAQTIFITITSIKCNLYIYSFQRFSAVSIFVLIPTESVDNKGKSGGRRGKSAAGNRSSSSEEEDDSDDDLTLKKRQDTTPEMKKIASASSILEEERKEESDAELLPPPTDDEEGEDARDSRKKASSSEQCANGEIKLKKWDSNNKVRI